MRALGYVRVSTDKQADFGVSLEAQTQKIRAMSTVQGAELVDVIVDAGESAKNLERPGMRQLLSLVDSRSVDVVIVAKLDRLTRSVKDLADLLERFTRRGVSLVSVAESLDTATAAGRLVLNIMVSVSQWEREAIGERTRDAMDCKKSRGERVGTVPFGYRAEVIPGEVPVSKNGRKSKPLQRLVPDGNEQDVLLRMRELRDLGYTLAETADELNRQGFRTRRGTPWRFQYVCGLAAAA
jgi:DNA invertase Pin-like site-specific DNA recombinase